VRLFAAGAGPKGVAAGVAGCRAAAGDARLGGPTDRGAPTLGGPTLPGPALDFGASMLAGAGEIGDNPGLVLDPGKE